MKRKRLIAMAMAFFLVFHEADYMLSQNGYYAQETVSAEGAGEVLEDCAEILDEPSSQETEAAEDGDLLIEESAAAGTEDVADIADLDDPELVVIQDSQTEAVVPFADQPIPEEISDEDLIITDPSLEEELPGERAAEESGDFTVDENGVLTGYLGETPSVVIPEGVTAIGANVFENHTEITSVAFPAGLVSIGKRAFSRCSGLTGSLALPEGLTSIGAYAFNGCGGLTGLTLPESLTSIGSHAFRGCGKAAGELVIPGQVQYIGQGTFSGMGGLTSAVFGEKVSTICVYNDSAHALYGWDNVETVRFLGSVPPSTDGYGANIFSFMPKLKTVYVPAGTYQAYNSSCGSSLPAGAKLKEEGSGDFVVTDGELVSYGGSDTEVTLPAEVTRIGAGAFRNNTDIQKVTIPAEVTSIGEDAFNGCSGLSEVTFAEGSLLTEIGARAFNGCGSLAGNLALPQGLASIGDSAFSECSGLTGLTLSESLTSIGDSVFRGCSGLTGITFPERLASIGNYAFYECSGLTDLTLPGSLTSIGNGAFRECSGLTGNLALPEGLTSIGEYAFYGCGGFTGLTLPESLTSIGASAFSGCSKAAGELVIPGQVQYIGQGTFSGMRGLTSVVFGEKVSTIYVYNDNYHALYGWDNVETVRFLGSVPPSTDGYGANIFSFMPNLKTVYIPAGTYQSYNSSYGASLPAGAKLKEEGSGDFLVTDGELVSYGGSDTEVTLPAEVTRIGAGAFRNNTDIQKVTIPAEVTSIGEDAFNGCSNLSEVTFAEGSLLTEIGARAFNGCGSLAGNLALPQGLASIGDSAFSECSGLTGLTLPESITSIGDSVFRGCSGLTGNLVLPEGLTSIGAEAFYECSGLTGLTFPESLVSIGNYAFYRCSSLTDLMLPGSLTSIGNDAFRECGGLTGNLALPEGLTSIGEYAFYGCSGLTGLTLPESLTSIGASAFSGCSKAAGELVIPGQVQYIGQGTFSGMRGLTSVVFGEKVSTIYVYNDDYHALYGWDNVETVRFLGSVPPSMDGYGANIFSFMPKLKTVYVPAGTYQAYNSSYGASLPAGAKLKEEGSGDFLVTDGELVSYGGSDTEVTLPAEVTRIGAGAFRNNTDIQKVTIPAEVTSIGEDAFNGCSNLSEVTFAEGSLLTEIGARAFNGCGSLAGNLALPQGLASIGDSAFSECSGLTGFTLPEGLTSIGDSVFRRCSGLTGNLVLPEGLTSIGAEVFYECSGLTGITFPERLVSIGNYAFYRCSGLTELTLPVGLTSIGNDAFRECSGLTGNLALPEGLTSIGAYAFYGCSNLTGLTLPESLTSIGASAFSGCSKVAGELVIPGQVQYIGQGTFSGMRGLTSVVFGEKVSTIYVYNGNYHALYGWDNVETVQFLGSVPPSTDGYGASIFSFMPNLKTVYIPAGTYQAYNSSYGSALPAGVRLKEEGSGDFLVMDGELVSYTGTDAGVALPAEVTRIGAGAFRNNTDIQKVTIPAEITSIGDDAFNGCSNLAEVVFGEGSRLTEIGARAFNGCGGLTGNLALPQGLASIGDSAFSECSGLTGLTLPEGITSIGDSVFQGCSGLTGNLILPEGLTSIGAEAFYECSGLTGLTFPESLVSIGNYAFYRCSSLTDLTLPGSLTSIGNDAFRECGGLTGNLALPEGLTSIGEYAFYGCGGLTGLTLPESLTSVGAYAFYGCSGVAGEIEIPGQVERIETGTFSQMKNVTSLVIGEKVSTVGTYYSSGHAFYSWDNVETVRFLGSVPPVASDSSYGIFSYMPKLKKIYVPEGSLEAYQSAYGSQLDASVEWSTDASQLPPANAKAEHIYSHTVHLTWKPVQSDLVAGYEVYRNGTEEGNLLTAEKIRDSFYTDTGLTAGETYTYYVRTCLTDGRTSGFAKISAVPSLPEIRRIHTENSSNKIGVTRNRIYAEVADTKNLESLGARETTGMFYYVNENDRRIPIGEGRKTAGRTDGTAEYEAAWDITDLEAGSYRVVFALTDGDGETAEAEETIEIDKSRPRQITGVMAIGDIDQITLTWGIAEELSTKGYRVYRKAGTDAEFRIIGYINERDTLTYTDKTVRKDHSYEYYVTGINDFKVESIPSEIVSASPASDTEKPRVIQMYPAHGSRISRRVSLGVQAEDNVGVRETRIYLSQDKETWTQICKSSSDFAGTEYDTSGISAGTLWMKGMAVDRNGNESEPFVYQYEVDNEGPSAVTLLEEQCVTTSVTATLAWENVPEEDVGYFRVEQLVDGAWERVGDVNSTLGMNLYALTPDTEYTYRVIAYDQLGNRGAEPEEGIVLRTKADETAPVITSLNPKPGSYNTVIPVSVTAQDDYGIRKIIYQVSSNGQEWSNAGEETFEEIHATVTAGYELPVAEYEDGVLYFRAIAEDFGGQSSDTGKNAPYVQHNIDHTPPAAPEITAVEGKNGYIEVTWRQNVENDLDGYQVFRKEADGAYEKIADRLYQVNYIDRNVKDGVKYSYRIKAWDRAGNLSEFSAEMAEAVQILPDTENPRIVSIYPADGSAVGDAFKTVRLLAQDNRALASVTVMWRKKGETQYRELSRTENIADYYKTIETALPLSELEDKEVLEIQVQAVDGAGNVSDPAEAAYTLDLTAPKLTGIRAEYADECVRVFWSGELPEDLIGYRVYRKENSGSSWSLIGQRQVVSGQTDYEMTDWNLPLERTALDYKVEAVDAVGNTSSKVTETPVLLPDRSSPQAVLNCESVMEAGVEYLFDASLSEDNTGIISYEIAFGDGEISHDAKAVHKYASTGVYTVTLTVVDEEGNSAIVEKEITVRERIQLGTLEVTVKDGDGRALDGAEVYFDLGSPNQFVRRTDGGGRAVFTAEAGNHAVGCVKGNNEYLPVKKEVVITANNTTQITMTLVHQPIVEGKFEIKRMTFDEIKAAGIDISDPENQYVVTVNVTLAYGTETIRNEIVYNPVTGWNNSRPVIVDTDSGKRALLPAILWPGGSGGSGGGMTGSGGGDSEEGIRTVSVVYLDIPIGVSALKEFFDVKLHIINNASAEFSMLDNQITLNVPKGLSIAETTSGTEQNAFVSIPKIPGQTTKTVEWILRGDEIGSYLLSADYSGILSEFNRPVTAHFEAEDPIEVYGLTGMKLTVHVGNHLKDGMFYYDTVLENQANLERYLPGIETPGELTEAVYYKGGTAAGVTIEPDSLEVMGIGDRLVYHYQDSVDVHLPEDEQLADRNAKLLEALYSAQHTYGLEVEIVEEELDYFEAARDTVNYFFNSQGGSQVEPIRDIKKGTAISVPKAPVKEGKYFGGWFEKADGTGSQLTHRTKASKTTIWYALWSDEPGSIAGIFEKLSSDEYGIRVTDNAGRPIAGARVTREDTRGSEEVTTDEDGDAIFPAFTVGTVALTIEKSGYVKFREGNYQVSSAGYDIIPLYKTSQESHILKKARYILTEDKLGQCDLLKKAKRLAENFSFKFAIECETAAGNTADERLELWQGNEKIAEAEKDGAFRKLSASDFTSGKGIHVRNYYDPDQPEKYVRTMLNLEIMEAPRVTGSFSLGDETGFTVGEDVPFLGGMSLGSGLPTFPVEFYIDPEENTMHLGINVKKGIFDKKEQREEFAGWISSMKQGAACGAMDAQEINRRYSEYCNKNGVMSLGGWKIKKPEVSFIGYFEGEMSGGNVSVLTGYVCISVKASAQYGWTIPTVFNIPMVVEIKVSGSGSVSGKVSYSLETYNLSGTLALNLAIALDALFGVGVSGVAAAGVTGGAGLDFEIYIASTNGDPGLNSVALSGSLGVKGYLGSAELSKNFAEGTWYLYTRNNERRSRRRMAGATELLYNTDNYAAVDRSYLERQSGWLGMQEDSGEVKSLLADTYGGAAPQTATAGETSVMVFRYDNGADKRDVWNMGQLVYSVWEDGKWQEPKPVDDNSLADISFELYSDGKAIYLTYQEAAETLTQQTAALNELAKHTVLRSMRFDVSTGRFVEETQLTEADDAAVCAFRPQYGTVNGKQIAVWVGNPQSDIFNLNSQNQLLCRVKENGVWGGTKTLLTDSNYISALCVGSLDGQAVIAYCVDGDNDPGTLADGCVYGMDLDGNVLFREEGGCAQIRYASEASMGMEGFLWNRDGTLMYRASLDTESVSLTGEDGNINSAFRFCGNSIYYVASDGNGKQNIFCIRKQDGRWSVPFQVTSQQEQIISFDVCQIGGEDYVTFMQSNMDFEKESNNLCWMKVGTVYDLALAGTSFEMADAIPGKDLKVTLKLRNNGSESVSQIGYRVTAGGREEALEGTVLTEAECGTVIGAGETADAEITVPLPEDMAAQKMTVQIWQMQEGQKVPELTEGNNYAEITAGLSDLAVSMELYTTAGKNTAVVTVRNESQVPCGGRLSVYDTGRVDGVVVQDETIAPLAPGQDQSFRLELGNDMFAKGVTELELVAEIKPDIADYSERNNRTAVIVQKMVQVTYYVDGALYAADVYQAGDNLILQPAPSGNRTFRGWFTGENQAVDGAVLTDDVEYYGLFQEDIGASAVKAVAPQCRTGSEIRPEPEVSFDGHILQKGTDYTVFWSNNVNSGTASITISGMGDYFGEKTVSFEILEHSWNGGTVTAASTCTREGEKVFTCTRCKAERKEKLPLAAHSYSSLGTVTRTATCVRKGEKVYTCICGAKKTEELPFTAHSYGSWTTVTEATVFKAALQHRICSVCGTKEERNYGRPLTPTIKINAVKLPMKVKQSVTKLRVTGFAKGDYVKSWKSGNSKLVTVKGKADGTCKITAKNKTGKTEITVTLASGLQKKVTVNIQKNAVNTEKITGLARNLTIARGKKISLRPELSPITSQQKITYSSSNKKIATVSSKGVIQAKKAGKAKITVKSGKKKFVVTVTVPRTKTVKITGVKERMVLKKGKTASLKAKPFPQNSDEKLTYKSSNRKVVTVSSTGKIKALKKGTAVITVKSGKATVKCKVTVTG